MVIVAEAEASRGTGPAVERSSRAAGLARQDGAHLIIWQALLATLPTMTASPRAAIAP